MADWDLPSLSSLWIDFLSDLKARDFDALSMGFTTILNPSQGMMRWNRTTRVWQEYDSGAWHDRILSVEGGGTNGATGGDAVTALGLGTMALQNANNVTIVGGSISALSVLGVNGSASIGTDLGVTNDLFVSGVITGNGSGISALNASALASGLVDQARLGSGAGGVGLKVLLDNQTWGYANMVAAARNETISFGSSATFQDVKDVNLSAFPGFSGVSDINEIAVFMNHGSRIERSSTGVEVSIAWQVLNTTPTVRFRRESITGAGTIQAEDINFTFWRIRVG